jgi:hypothetical protein
MKPVLPFVREPHGGPSQADPHEQSLVLMEISQSWRNAIETLHRCSQEVHLFLQELDLFASAGGQQVRRNGGVEPDLDPRSPQPSNARTLR